MKAIFNLEIRENVLCVKGEIPYIANEKTVEIELGKNVEIKNMHINGNNKVKESVNAYNDYFRIYSIDDVHEDGTIYIEYESIVEGENNILNDEILAINVCSNVFPTQLPDYISESTCYFINGFENYDIMYSYVDGNSGFRAKDTKKQFGEIVNIIGYKKDTYKKFEVGNIKVYYRTENSYENLYECAQIGVEALEYYNKIYSKKEAKIELFELGLGHPSACCRGDMIVAGGAPDVFSLSYFSEEMLKTFPLTEDEVREYCKYALFAHELGHRWFCNAETISYEDWLNETGAEWSMFLFVLNRNDKKLFDTFYKYQKYQHMVNKEPIRTEDGHKPNAVHSSGVVLFYKVYEKYGIDTVLKLLQILSGMNKQYTDGFLERIRTDLCEEIADFISDRLDSYIEEKL